MTLLLKNTIKLLAQKINVTYLNPAELQMMDILLKQDGQLAILMLFHYLTKSQWKVKGNNKLSVIIL